MASTFEMATYQEMTAQIVHDVFETMLLYPIHESSDAYDARSTLVTSAISLTGSWNGAVILECSEQQARFFTGRLMGIPQPAHMNDDTRDAMGELANVIGGNVKSVLPNGVFLSLPSVLEGPDCAYKMCGSNENVRLSFRGEGGPLWVTLIHITEIRE